MVKTGLPKHRFTLAILNWLYVICSASVMFVMVFRGLYFIPFTCCCFYVLIGLSGLYILSKEDSKLLSVYRRILIGILVTQILTFIVFIIILCFRSYIAEAFLEHLMQNYYRDNSLKDYMDTIQINFECCGPHSYKDWVTSIPSSCCGKSIRQCNYSSTKLLGCKENLSMFFLLICLAFLFVSTGNIFLHAYCIRCAFKLSKEYDRVKTQILQSKYELSVI